jgi:16S rRNA C967 or C1407 C5-methylase (RsmB/RsmF family)/NOL1/NOP2/fmu family ribosome biogenesis protein
MSAENHLPKVFEDRMQLRLGIEWDPFQQSFSLETPSSIRLNTAKVKEPLVGTERVLWSQSGYYLDARPSFTSDPWFHAGAYYPQEASSMILEQALQEWMPNSENLIVLDLCAAPGGKSTHLISLLHPDSLLVSNEVIKPRANILMENLAKWGYPNSVVCQNDPSQFSELEGFFDLIVVDAPCSGEGLFRKDLDARKEWSPANCDLCAERQKRILSDIWPALKPGGLLIYSTCTYNPKENEQNVHWLVDQFDAEVLSLQNSFGFKEIYWENKLAGYSAMPHLIKGEGFFISGLRKRDGATSRPDKKGKISFDRASKAESTVLKEYLSTGDFVHLKNREQLLAFPAHWEKELNMLSQKLRLISYGLNMGEWMKGKLNPSPELALSTHFNSLEFPALDVDLEDALRFLSKSDLAISSSINGWNLIRYKGLILGWIKQIGHRANNYWPGYWRIRMDVFKELEQRSPQLVSHYFKH